MVPFMEEQAATKGKSRIVFVEKLVIQMAAAAWCKGNQTLTHAHTRAALHTFCFTLSAHTSRV